MDESSEPEPNNTSPGLGSLRFFFTMIFCVLEMTILKSESSIVCSVVPVSSRKWNLIFVSRTRAYSGGTTLVLSKVIISRRDCKTVLSGANTSALWQKLHWPEDKRKTEYKTVWSKKELLCGELPVRILLEQPCTGLVKTSWIFRFR